MKTYNRIQHLILSDDFEYIPSVPAGFRLATLLDFITINLNNEDGYDLNIGMLYLMQNKACSKYYLRSVSEHLKDEMIIPYIETQQVFIS